MYQILSSFLLLALLGIRRIFVSAVCIGPQVNQASLDLIKEFEGWEPDICMNLATRKRNGPRGKKLMQIQMTTLLASLRSDTATFSKMRAAQMLNITFRFLCPLRFSSHILG